MTSDVFKSPVTDLAGSQPEPTAAGPQAAKLYLSDAVKQLIDGDGLPVRLARKQLRAAGFMLTDQEVLRLYVSATPKPV